MSKQPEALRLADRLASGWPALDDINSAVLELRRLHAENEQLRKERDDLKERWAFERKVNESQISGGFYPDGVRAW